MAAEGREKETQTVDDNGADDGKDVQEEKEPEQVESGTTESRKRKSKPRATTSKKERRRTQNINAAFGDLRNHIPNVPADTKLSKIKTLKLAMSYIRHLEKILDSEEGQTEPKLERKYSSSSETEAELEASNNTQQNGFGFDAVSLFANITTPGVTKSLFLHNQIEIVCILSAILLG